MTRIVRMSESKSRAVDTEPVYKKITHGKTANYLSVTNIIPRDWKIIEIIATKPTDGKMIFNIRKVA